MRRRQVIELAVGTGLLLGPLVYALTLEPGPAPECAAAVVEPASVVVETVVIDRCEQPPAVESEPEPAPAVEPTAELAEFLFVTDAGLVLSTEAERGWGTGRLFEPKGTVSYRAAKRADATKVPEHLWSMRGRSYDLYGPDGKVCTARLGDLRVLAQYDGWGLGGVLGEERSDPERASEAEIREGLWRRDDLWLVAEIESSDSCEGAMWARDAELPPPAILRQSTAESPTTRAREAAFERSEELAETEANYRAAHAEVLELEREYRAEYPDDPHGEFSEFLAYNPDWERVLAEGPTLSSWLDAQGRPQLVDLDFGHEPDGCGDPLYSRITALDYVRGDGFEPSGHGYGVSAIFDADGDGRYEFLYHPYFVASETLGQSVFIEEDWQCPC